MIQFKSKKTKSGKIAVAERIGLFFGSIALSGIFCFGINNIQISDKLPYAQASLPQNLQLQTLADNPEPANYPAQIIQEKPSQRFKPELELNVKSVFAFMIDADGKEKELFANNTSQQLPIASLTKLMTATIILDHPDVYDLSQQVAIDEISASENDVPVFGNLKKGEIYTIRQLLNLMLFYSSNDAAAALSRIIDGGLFVSQMNLKALDIGMVDTKFYNAHGLDGSDGTANYSSAKDLADLVRYILKYYPEIFAFSTKSGPYLNENGILNLDLWDGEKLVGGKTGFTEKAGGCMIVIFKDQSDAYYANIVLGSASPESRVIEMQKLINFVNNKK